MIVSQSNPLPLLQPSNKSPTNTQFTIHDETTQKSRQKHIEENFSIAFY
jgi:hypothetical protein